MDYAWLVNGAWEFTRRNKAVMLLGLTTWFSTYAFQFERIYSYFAPESSLLASTPLRIIFLLGLYLVLTVLGIWGKAAIVHIVLMAYTENHEEDAPLLAQDNHIVSVIKNMLTRANTNMPSLIRLNIIWFIGVFILVALVYVIALTLATSGNEIYTAFRLGAIVLTLPTTFLVSRVWQQSAIAMVVEDLTPKGAIQRGYQIVMDNLGNFIAMSLITIILYVLPVLVVNLVSFGINNIAPPSSQLIPYILVFLFSSLVYSIYYGFTNVVWVQVFLQLTQPTETD